MDLIRALWPAAELESFCQRLLHAEARPRFGRTLPTDREMVQWGRADWPELWDLCLLRMGAHEFPGLASVKVLAPYVIRYRTGVELAGHHDSGAMRMIVLARAPDGGGVLSVDGSPVPLSAGDAAVFSDEREHAVTKITAGERWTITMGVDQGGPKVASALPDLLRKIAERNAARRRRR